MATPRRLRARLSARYLAAGAVGVLVLGACGTRVSDERVVQASKGGPAEVSTIAGTEAVAAAPGASAPTATNGGTATTPGQPDAGTASQPGQAQSAPSAGGATKGQSTDGKATGGTGGSAKAGTNTSAGCTQQGPPIVLGQVVSFSGFIGANVGSAVPVLGAWAKHINAQGGIACHPVQLFSADDASDPGKSSAAVQDLVKNKKAIGLVANFVPLSISGFKSALNSVKVPAVGGDLYSTTWWSDPLFYPVGTYVDGNAIGSTVSVAKGGANKVASIYCIEAAICPPYNQAVKRGAANGGYQVVYDVQITVTAPDYTTQCQSAKNAGATQLSMIVEGSTVSRFARSCAAIGYFPKFAVASLGATFAPTDENVRKMSVTIASASNDWYSSDSAGQKTFQDAMKRYAPTLKLDPTSPLAWADGMMVKAAIEKLGAAAVGVPITTEMLRKGLSMIKNETLQDMIKPTSFSPSQGVNPKTPCYYSMVFSKAGSPPGRWEDASSGCLKPQDLGGSAVTGASSLSPAAPATEGAPNLAAFRSRARG